MYVQNNAESAKIVLKVIAYLFTGRFDQCHPTFTVTNQFDLFVESDQNLNAQACLEMNWRNYNFHVISNSSFEV